MNEHSNRNGSLNKNTGDSLSQHEKALADVTALALGQTDAQESERIEREIHRNSEMKAWFDDADSISNLVRLSSDENLPPRNSELAMLIEAELDQLEGDTSNLELDETDEVTPAHRDPMTGKSRLVKQKSSRWIPLGLLTAVAGCLLIFLFLPATQKVRESAHRPISYHDSSRESSQTTREEIESFKGKDIGGVVSSLQSQDREAMLYEEMESQMGERVEFETVTLDEVKLSFMPQLGGGIGSRSGDKMSGSFDDGKNNSTVDGRFTKRQQQGRGGMAGMGGMSGQAIPNDSGILRVETGLAENAPGRVDSSTSNEPGKRMMLLVEPRLLPDDDDADYSFGIDLTRERADKVGGGREGKGNGKYSSREQYELLPENKFIRPIGDAARSTFSVDVDTASYSNVRRMIQSGHWPNPAAVRIEEFVNYFKYDYPEPQGNDLFHVSLDSAICPWNKEHRLVRIGIKAKDIHRQERPNSNLVFLVDVSGSMSSDDKLPLLKRGLLSLVDQLGESDFISIVTYAGDAGVALQPTSGDQKQVIRNAIERLQAGGSTHGSAGIQLAYEMATQHFIKGGVNRVLLATDGDLNVGVTDDDALVQLIKEKAASNVFLTILGFGTGNLQDAKLKKLASNGNGIYAYIDSARESYRVLVEQMSGSLVTIAKDFKMQLEFNPAEVAVYRLIGYERRVMANADFHNDKKDAGDIGAGHTVTAFYEIVPVGAADESVTQSTTGLKYQQPAEPSVAQPSPVKLSDAAKSGELLTLHLNYKRPESSERERDQSFTLLNHPLAFESAPGDFQFAAAVASFGLLLRNSQYQGTTSLEFIERVAAANLGVDPFGYRSEFVDLVRQLRRQAAGTR